MSGGFCVWGVGGGGLKTPVCAAPACLGLYLHLHTQKQLSPRLYGYFCPTRVMRGGTGRQHALALAALLRFIRLNVS